MRARLNVLVLACSIVLAVSATAAASIWLFSRL